MTFEEQRLRRLVEYQQVRIDELLERLADLQGVEMVLPWGLHLTPRERAVATIMFKAAPNIVPIKSFDILLDPFGEMQTVTNSVKVYIHRLRVLLGFLGIEIVNHWGVGYSISAEDRAAWDDWCSAHAAGKPRPEDYPLGPLDVSWQQKDQFMKQGEAA